ncbi:MAG: undecaprenyl-diphosphate phosphatase [bacterium]
MNWVVSFILGLVQGVTEILPISSDGHLAVIQYILKIPQQVRVNLTAALHLGTSLAIVGFFAKRIKEIIQGAFSADSEQRSHNRGLMLIVFLGSFPAGLAGLLIGDIVETTFANLKTIGVFFLINGVVLFSTVFPRKKETALSWRQALLIGMIQATAIFPAISRSGTTIALALLLGVKRYQAFEFSFLLAIPITLGAAVYELLHFDFAVITWNQVLLGVVTAGLFGISMILLLRRFVLSRWFFLFGIYCWLLGIVVIFFLH